MPLIEPMTPAFASYLSDESRTQGQAEYIAFPRSEEEIAQVLRWCAQHGVPVTAQGGMTGLAGGATCKYGGIMLSVMRMNKIFPWACAGTAGAPGCCGCSRGFGCCRCARR